MAITRVSVTNDSGDRVSGTSLNQAFFTSLYDSLEVSWATTAYTPALTSSGSAPSTSAASGAYFRIGKFVTFYATVTINAVGTGNYSLSLPPFNSLSVPTNIRVFASDVSAGGVIYNGSGFINATTSFLILTSDAPSASNFTPTVPITFAAGDILYAFGSYFSV